MNGLKTQAGLDKITSAGMEVTKRSEVDPDKTGGEGNKMVAGDHHKMIERRRVIAAIQIYKLSSLSVRGMK